MVKFQVIVLTFVLSLTLSLQEVNGQNIEKPKPKNRVLFVLDASNSMYGIWQSDRKINIARQLLSNLLDSLKTVDNVELALRVYGHLKPYPPQDCDDTKLEVPFAPSNSERIKRKLNTIVPRGTTPIARSLEACVNDFPECDNCRNIIVLITDGIEECDGDPCAVSRQLQNSGIILKPFIIGIGRNFKSEFECVGTYFDASSERQFRQALNVVISQALNSTTTQVNLLDEKNNPTETNVALTFYDYFSGEIKYDFIHTLNSRGLPDTMVVDPLTIYKVVAHTIPPVKNDSVKLTPGKHTIIPIDAPQGYLNLKVGGRDNLYRDIQCIVRKAGSEKTLHVQNFKEVEKYITGKYDLEILCLPRIIVKDVAISQSHTTDVVIPVPGLARITYPGKGYGSLFVEEGSKIRNIYNINSNTTKESIILQPGHYRIVFRIKYNTRSFYTIKKSFVIKSGETSNILIKN